VGKNREMVLRNTDDEWERDEWYRAHAVPNTVLPEMKMPDVETPRPIGRQEVAKLRATLNDSVKGAEGISATSPRHQATVFDRMDADDRGSRRSAA
jgi:hypothetical protein